MSTCEGKTGYRSQKQAARALALIRFQTSVDPVAGRKPIRVYRCPICRMYHLTSQPKRRIERR